MVFKAVKGPHPELLIGPYQEHITLCLNVAQKHPFIRDYTFQQGTTAKRMPSQLFLNC